MRSRDEQMRCDDDGLDALVSAVVRSAEPMPEDARTAVRERLLEEIAPTAVPLRVRMLRPAVTLAIVGSLLGGVSYAAAQSREGEPLFRLKQSIVSTVRSAQRALSHKAAQQRPADASGRVEAPSGRKPEGNPSTPPVVQHVAPKATQATPTPPGQSKAKPQGNGKGKGSAVTKRRAQRGNGASDRRVHPNAFRRKR